LGLKGDSMRVNKLVLKNFRNYDYLEADFVANVNIFIGDNAQGKTNILEAIYLGAFGRSHRTSNEDDLIAWNQQNAVVDISFSRQGVPNKLGFRFLRDKNKENLLNDFTVKTRDIIGSLNVVLFSPEDLWLIKGVPALRRRFLDIEISQAVPAYYRHLLQYGRILHQRNNLLKKIRERKANVDLLETWDEQLTKTAVLIINKRMESLKKLSMLANLMNRRITNNKENLQLSYFQAGAGENFPEDLGEWFIKSLKNDRQQDIDRGSTGIGPHRDDIILYTNGRDLRNFGSQGQQRTGILALKLAELEFLKAETGEYPVLLLDDVMSELDGQRREHLMTFIRDKIQTFVTATEATLFPSVKQGQYYRVKDGRIAE